MGKFVRNAGKKATHKGGAVDAVTKPGPSPVQTPDEWHPIRGEIVVGVGKIPEGRFVAAHGDDLSVGKIKRQGAGLTGPRQAIRAERFVIGYEQWSAEDLEGGHFLNLPKALRARNRGNSWMFKKMRCTPGLCSARKKLHFRGVFWY